MEAEAVPSGPGWWPRPQAVVAAQWHGHPLSQTVLVLHHLATGHRRRSQPQFYHTCPCNRTKHVPPTLQVKERQCSTHTRHGQGGFPRRDAERGHGGDAWFLLWNESGFPPIAAGVPLPAAECDNQSGLRSLARPRVLGCRPATGSPHGPRTDALGQHAKGHVRARPGQNVPEDVFRDHTWTGIRDWTQKPKSESRLVYRLMYKAELKPNNGHTYPRGESKFQQTCRHTTNGLTMVFIGTHLMSPNSCKQERVHYCCLNIEAFLH